MRPVMRVDSPPAFPHVCIICGLGVGPMRRFFADLGFDIAGSYQAVQEGAVYLCNECIPGMIESLLAIMNDDRNRVMDNSMQKEEVSYGFMDRIAGRSELQSVQDGEPSDSVSGAVTDRGTLSVLDTDENLPDSGEHSSSEEHSGVVDETDRVASETSEPEVPGLQIPHFRRGARVS